MTEREAQIYEWIKEDPMISQQEIADRAGITRSSAAVHISNLMKKGMIRGKGYVLQEENYVTVVGGVNIDISGTPFEKLRFEDSNPGRMKISLGGVGRNIADNMSRLGTGVQMITALGDDFYASELEKNSRQIGIDLIHSLRVPGESTSVYLCMNNEKGDMAVAISDMEIYNRLTPEYIETKLSVINKGRFVVLDGNIPEQTIEYIVNNAEVPVIAEPVSVGKAKKFRGVLGRLFLIKPNKFELEVLSGMSITDDANIERAAQKLNDLGVEHVVVSCGDKGVYYASKETKKYIKSLPCNVVNTTGCGDALLGGLVWALNNDKPVEQAINYGLAAAAVCIEHHGAINIDISEELLEKKLADAEQA